MAQLIRYGIGGFVACFIALLAYWQTFEAYEPGRQYADPLLPCLWMAWMFGWPLGWIAAIAVTLASRFDLKRKS